MALAYPNANTWEKFFLKNVEAEASNKLITAIREKMLDTQTCLRVVRSGAGRSRILWSRVSDRARAAVASCGREWRWWELLGDSPLSPPRPVLQRYLPWPLP